MNKVILIGNLTRDPEAGKTPSGVDSCRFSIAVSRDYANADGTRETDFFNVITWRKQAENCGKYLKKGNKVAICGQLQNRKVEDGKGDIKTYTDIIADNVEFLTPKDKTEESTAVTSSTRVRQQEMDAVKRHNFESIENNNLPF